MADRNLPHFSWDAPKAAYATSRPQVVDAQAFGTRAVRDRALLTTALREGQATGDTHQQLRALRALSECQARTGDFERSCESAQNALAVAESLVDDRAILEVLREQATALARAGHALAARAALTSAMARSEQRNDLRSVSSGLTQLGVLDLVSDNVPEARHAFDRAFALGREADLTVAKGDALSGVGCLFVLNRQYVEALDIWHRAALLYERGNDVGSLGKAHNNCGVVHHLAGRFVNAIPYFERALELLGPVADAVTMLGLLSNNLLAHELHYLDRGAHYREGMEAFREVLTDPDLPRFGDLTTMTLPTPCWTGEQTFASDLFVGTPVVLLPLSALGAR